MHKKIPILVFIVTLIFFNSHSPAADKPDASKFFNQVETLVKKFYPQATIHQDQQKMSFSYETMEFMIHLPWKTGEWQKASPMVGPKRHGGIVGSVEVNQGVWNGAAGVPQSFDRSYFTALLMAPYSPQCDCHVVAHLDYPDTVNQDFLKEWQELINSFNQEESYKLESQIQSTHDSQSPTAKQ